MFRESTKAWIGINDDGMRWLKDGSFLWLSDRSGWTHIYHYGADGKLIKQVTNGDWDVQSFGEVDEEKGAIYFSASEHSYIANHVYAIKIEGTGLSRITMTEGNHRASFNRNATYFIDSWNDVNTPTQVRLYEAAGKMVRVIDENKVDALAQYKLGKVEFVQVKTRDGFVMEAMMIKPPDFDPSKKYPVYEFTYSGPHAQSVRNSWGGAQYLFHQFLAQHGVIVWICDNRSASGKGAESAWTSYKRMGEGELRDLEDGLKWLTSQPYVDGSHVALSGWSYGGFMTSFALTHSKLWSAGLAGGTVSDWRDYDSIYTERVMLMPQNNPEGYKTTAPRW